LTAAVGATLAAEVFRESRRGFDLRSKVVLITGGSRGLGLELARAFALRGARLALCARDEAELAEAERELRATGVRVETFTCDVGDEDDVTELIREVEETFGGIDVLVNVAGVIQVGPVKTVSLDDFREARAANFWGMVHTCWAALPQMRAQGGGRIVNVTSIGGVVSVPHLLPYSASKFAAVGFSTGLHSELAPEGIRVTTIVPGLMRTGSVDNALFKGNRKAEFTWFAAGDSLPLVSMSASRAARRIVRACERGEGYVVVGVPAKLLREFSGVFPRATQAVMALVAQLLPSAGTHGSEEEAEPGRLHRAGVPKPLTALSDEAAVRNNEEPTVH
jgi:NAD(P)-dependent dehydrogenase (short-subunit alcohol dehydrogenase family)